LISARGHSPTQAVPAMYQQHGSAGGVMVGGHGAGGVHMHGGAVGVGPGGGGMVVAGGISGAGAGGSGCEVACCGDATGPGVMTYVGGGGSYTTETTYKYVGRGAGEFSYVTPKTTNWLPFIIGAILVLAIILAVALNSGNPTTTTTPKPEGPPGDCLLWGDPHVETFDHGFPNFYDEGEFWVVKSPVVSIQGRYLATPFTNGLSATHQIAVGGPFLNGRRIVVGPMENGQITMDGQPILQAFPSTLDDSSSGIQLSYNSEGKLVDNAQGHLERHIVHMELPLGVHLQIMRWANHLNVRITMTPREGGQDGSCGNFNGNAADDSTAAIKGRIGQRVAVGDLLFNVPAQVGPGGKHVTVADCEHQKREHATQVCKAKQPQANGNLLETCIFDVCFGGDQYAGEDGLAESEA